MAAAIAMISPTTELKAFDATARCGSMSAAARLLGVRQPTISAHLANLEIRYGVELFHRSGRGVTLTEFGRLLHEITHRMYRAEEQARHLLQSARQQFIGHLKLCAVGPYNITPIIQRFRHLHGNIRVSLHLCDSRQIIARILDQQDDIGLPVHAVDDARVFSLPFRRQKLIVFASVRHPLARQTTLRLRDLDDQEFVLREEGSRTRQVFEAGLSAVGLRVRCAVEMGSREAVREAVAQGLGLGVVARTALVADPRLVELPVIDMDMHTHAHLTCLRERLQAGLIHRFLDVAKQLALVHAAGDATAASD